MHQPVIGLSCHAWPGEITRSALGQRYVDAVVAAGGAPIGIPLGLGPAALRRVYTLIDGLFLPGGDDIAPDRYGHEPHPLLGKVDPARDELEITLARWALDDDLPVLGICRGIQVLAVAAGGTLHQDIASELSSDISHDRRGEDREGLTHAVSIDPGTVLCAAVGCNASRVNSMHHQSIRDVPAGFIVSARSEDGVVEGIEAPAMTFAVGIQCHPEWIWNSSAPEYEGLFKAFVDAAARRAAKRAA